MVDLHEDRVVRRREARAQMSRLLPCIWPSQLVKLLNHLGRHLEGEARVHDLRAVKKSHR